jgi:hypothetical protein
MIRALGLATAMTLATAPLAHAQAEIFSPATVSGHLELRAAAVDAETSWIDGGFGKGRFGDGEGWKADGVANGVIEWRPRFNWGLSAVVDAEYQSDQEHPLAVGEAYLLYKPLLPGGTRIQVRAGSFWTPVSLEHDGPRWTVSRTITPSAINSWISEEVKGSGVEVSLRRDFSGHELGLTVGGVAANDTAGALLALRGWSFSDARSTIGGHYPLPPMSPFVSGIQPDRTTPSLELDDRTGYYVRADWRAPSAVAFNVETYDNQGDKVSLNDIFEWSWRTRFTNVGMVWRPTDDTEVLAQAMSGRTEMGYSSPAGIWVDVSYRSAYVLASRRFGDTAVTGRLDAFSNKDNANPFYGDTSEDGWAATAAVRRALSPHIEVLAEALYVDSDRPSRALAGAAPRQTDLTLLTAARLSF